jgi:hypothetical protein
MRLTLAPLALPALAALAALALVLGAGDGARAGGVSSHDFVGAERCRSCHVEEFRVWAEGPHARALQVLSDKERRDPSCQQCHTMVPEDMDPALGGIQCETCHGAGKYYSERHVMRDAELRSQLSFVVPDEKTCVRCHTESSPSLRPFRYEEKLEKIRHWKPKP